MRCAVGVVRAGHVVGVEGDSAAMNAASLAKQVIGHVALEMVADLDEPIWHDVTARHVLTHTTGLPNWRSTRELVPLRPPGVRWGYSGEGVVLLQRFLEEQSGRDIDALAKESLFAPLGMNSSFFDAPEPGYHGLRPLMTTARDYATFLAFVLGVKDDRWAVHWPVTDRIAWGLGWGLELGHHTYAWQWGANADASNFVLGSPSTRDGVVVFTDSARGVDAYAELVRTHLPGDHPSLDVWSDAGWLGLFN